MSLSEREIGIIHRNTSIIEGRKHFGEYNHQVSASSTTEYIPVTSLTAETAVVIPVMEREEKLKIFLDRFTQAVASSGVPTTLIVMDNSLTTKFLKEVQSRTQALKDGPLVSVIYHHDARLTQTSLRNYALEHLVPSEASTIGLWDSDIYCSKRTLAELRRIWNKLSDIDGIAPPLVGYKSGDIDKIIAKYARIREDSSLRTKAHMPGSIGEENGVWQGDLLRTTMMRGAFFVSKELLSKIARQTPNQTPWIEDFAVWQNVPFFLAAREMGSDFGYVMVSDAVVAHDDNIDELSVGYSMPYRRSETLKSLVMLMYRNSVYTEQSKSINTRFLRFNLDAIARVCEFNREESKEMQDVLLEISEMINKSTEVGGFIEAWNIRKNQIPEKYIRFADEVVAKLSDEEVYQRVKAIRSADPLHPMYSI